MHDLPTHFWTRVRLGMPQGRSAHGPSSLSASPPTAVTTVHNGDGQGLPFPRLFVLLYAQRRLQVCPTRHDAIQPTLGYPTISGLCHRSPLVTTPRDPTQCLGPHTHSSSPAAAPQVRCASRKHRCSYRERLQAGRSPRFPPLTDRELPRSRRHMTRAGLTASSLTHRFPPRARFGTRPRRP